MDTIGNKEKLLAKIKKNNEQLNNNEVNKILILYDLNMFLIGDTCVKISRLLKMKSFYPNSIIDINTVDTGNYTLINTILLNNPYINSFYNLNWNSIDFGKYNVIIVGCIPEETFFNFFSERYANEILCDKLRLSIYSACQLMGFDEIGEPIFPKHDKLINYKLSEREDLKMMANMLFITDLEQNWACNWLSSLGLLEHENVAIFLDNAGSREKLLRMNVYFDVLSWFLIKSNVKILIFDENKIGKKDFYTEWVGSKFSNKFIFVEGLGLRDAISLIGNRSIKFIFGPSTGLLHCASGIYNILCERGLSVEDIPIMIAYIGKLNRDFEENLWWGNSLVDGLLLVKNENNCKEIKNIKEIDFQELKRNHSFYPSSDFTSEAILEYIKKKYYKKLIQNKFIESVRVETI